jgi:hypothetical protein
VIIRPELQGKHPVDLAASMTCGNHRNIGTRPDLSEQLEPVLLPKPKIEYDQARVHAELRHNCPPTRGSDNVDVIFIEVGDYHILDLGVVISDQDPHRLTVLDSLVTGHRGGMIGAATSRGSNDLATCGYTTGRYAPAVVGRTLRVPAHESAISTKGPTEPNRRNLPEPLAAILGVTLNYSSSGRAARTG